MNIQTTCNQKVKPMGGGNGETIRFDLCAKSRPITDLIGSDKESAAMPSGKVRERNWRMDKTAVEQAETGSPGASDGFLKTRQIMRKYAISLEELHRLVGTENIANFAISDRGSKSGHGLSRVYSRFDIEQALKFRPKDCRRAGIRAAIGIGMRNTRKTYRDEFFAEILRPLMAILKKAFGAEWDRDVKALKIIMRCKRLEKEDGDETYPHKPRRHWKTILENVREWHELKEKALERTVRIRLSECRFTLRDGAQNQRFTMERRFGDFTYRPFIARVDGPRPWSLSIYLDGEQIEFSSLMSGEMEFSKLLFDEYTISRLRELDSYLRTQSELSVNEFSEAMRWRLANAGNGDKMAQGGLRSVIMSGSRQEKTQN